MTTLHEAAQQALEAWEHINKYGFVLADYEGPMEQAITALKAALKQPEQEPVAWMNVLDGGYKCLAGTQINDWTPLYTHPPRREWRLLSAEEIAKCWHDTPWNADLKTRVFAFSRAVEAAHGIKEQEPVARMREGWGSDCGPYVEFYRSDEMGWRDRNGWTPLYTHPPLREWRSLTEEQIRHFAWNGFLMAEGTWDKDTEEDLLTFARAIEAALRSKNHE